METLNPEQEQIVNAISGMLANAGYPRSAKEICGAFRDVFQPQAVLDALEYMARRGLVAVDSGATGRRFSSKEKAGHDVG